MLGIIVALPWELKSLTHETIAPGSWKEIAPGKRVALSGMGAERAHAAASLLIEQGAAALMSWGCAAALDEGSRAGSLLLPLRVIDARGETYPVDVEWHQRLYVAAASRLSVRTGALVQSEAVVKTAAEKHAMAERTGAAATDMESAAHARAAAQRGLPYVAVRAIIDTASTEIPGTVLRALDADGAIDLAKLFARAFSARADWMKIVRLAIQFCAARKTLKYAREAILNNSQF
jgi:adenosylhomocysteine nucleosidase